MLARGLLYCLLSLALHSAAEARLLRKGTKGELSVKRHKVPSLFNPTAAIQWSSTHSASASSAVLRVATADTEMLQPPDSLYQPILDKHNEYRALHGAPLLQWDQGLADAAAAYIAQCSWGHDANRGYAGENMYATSVASDGAEALMQAVDGWYQEVAYYDHTQPGFFPSTGHFTQVVWRDSTSLGCAVHTCSSVANTDWDFDNTLVICRYSPPGNIWGEFESNVFPTGTVYQPPADLGSPTPVPYTPAPVPVSPPPTPGNPTPISDHNSDVVSSPSPAMLSPSPAPVVAQPEPVDPTIGFNPAATLLAGAAFSAHDGCLMSGNRKYKLCVTQPGVVMLSQVKPRKVLWKTNKRLRKKNVKPAWFWLRSDGTLTVVDDNNAVIWIGNRLTPGAAVVTGPVNPILVLKDDGDMAIYDHGTLDTKTLRVHVGDLLWHTNTAMTCMASASGR